MTTKQRTVRTLTLSLVVLCGLAAFGFGPQSANAGELYVDNNRCECVDVYANGNYIGTVNDHSQSRLWIHSCHGCTNLVITTHSGWVLWRQHAYGNFRLHACIH